MKSDGTLWAWGWNASGQVGDGTLTDGLSPGAVPGFPGAAASSWTSTAAVGGNHTVAVKSDGTVWAWGYNSTGQLGDKTTTDQWQPVQVTGLSGVVAVAAGIAHTVAVESDGTVWAWGNNENGQLGDETTTDRWLPVQVAGLSGVTAVAAGDWHSVALKSDGTVWAWGANGEGPARRRNHDQQFAAGAGDGPFGGYRRRDGRLAHRCPQERRDGVGMGV